MAAARRSDIGSVLRRLGAGLLGHQRIVDLARPDRSWAAADPAEIVFKDGPLVDRAEHHPPADLRADIDVGGGELIAADIGAGADAALERVDRLLEAAISGHHLLVGR